VDVGEDGVAAGWVGWGRKLWGHSQLDPIVRGMNEVLLRAQVPLRCLDTRVAEQQLDLLKLATSRTAQLNRRAP